MDNFETKIISTKYTRPDAYGALAMPVYHTAAFEFPSAKAMENAFMGRSMDHSYSRISNPTVQYLERRVQQVTGALSVTALNTGMAAIAYALMAVASEGSNIIISPFLFGNTVSLIRDTLGNFGVEARFADLTNLKDVEEKIDERTCAVFFEIITNPQMIVTDIRSLADIAHRHNVALIADTTIIPFTAFRAADFGVDIEVISSTKYISGGATGVGGLLIDYGHTDWSKSHSPALQAKAKRTGARTAFTARVKTELVTNLGALMSPHAAYMETLGLETLDLRFRQQASSALWLARELKTTEGIRSVNYPGLEDNPYHNLSEKQFGHLPGAMLTIDLDSKDDCYQFIDNLKLIRRATNLFDNRSLAIHPASTIFGLFSEEQRAAMDVRQTTVRLSIGLEQPADLLKDIQQALPK
ncbi:MAG: O-acetylhomoserine aminocarboxypropyltransferase/cysteine synthase [Prevotella sp.]|nr:O-acetylhomoserine aminocarboxypropyltransferase/cysteine synthase [Prevotella sp.]